MDKLFSGIPGQECKGLHQAGLPAEEMIKLKPGATSICALKKLRRLCIDGPSRKFGARAVEYAKRGEKFTDIFPYSTLALCKELNLNQVATGLAEFSPTCLEHACARIGLELVTKIEGGDRKSVV